MFLGQGVVLFEGNLALLNLYSELNEPKKMFESVVYAHLSQTVLCLVLGVMTYWAFGQLTETVVLYNLPHESIPALMTECFSILVIVGSFSIII